MDIFYFSVTEREKKPNMFLSYLAMHDHLQYFVFILNAVQTY